MARVFMQHPVADYSTWRPIFDADQPNRKSAGVVDVAVLRDADDPNSIWMVFEADPSVLDPMLADTDRQGLMQEAGVLAPPQIWVV